MNRQQVLPYKKTRPQLAESVFLAEGSMVIGDVALGEGASVWFNAIIRGDVNQIRIGNYTNIQDGAVIHVDARGTLVGDNITVGHNAILHGCTVANNCLIGMGAIILSGAEIGENSIVGAGALVTQGKKFPPNSLIVGSPAQVVRSVSDQEAKRITQSAQHYYELAQDYQTSE